MQKLQSQGVHHITLVGADRQTSIDFWEGLLGMPFVFEQPNLDNAGESHLYFDPGDGRLITVFTNEDADARPAPHADRSRLRPPHRDLALEGDVRPGRRAPRGARDRAQRRQGSRLHGLDLLRRPARAHDRARGVPLRAAARLHARRGAARGAQAPRRARRPPHRAGATSPMRSRISSSARAHRSPTTARRRTRTDPTAHRGRRRHVRDHAQHPQAERQQPHRPDLRSGGGARLRGGRRLGQDRRARVPGEGPGPPDADDRGGGAAARVALGELRDHAVPLQHARPRALLPDRRRASGRWSTARCST